MIYATVRYTGMRGGGEITQYGVDAWFSILIFKPV